MAKLEKPSAIDYLDEVSEEKGTVEEWRGEKEGSMKEGHWHTYRGSEVTDLIQEINSVIRIERGTRLYLHSERSI